MANLRCKACLGTYSDILRDGTRYFHVCAPLPNPAWIAQFTVGADGKLRNKGTVDLSIPEFITRTKARDENITTDAAGKTIPKSDGDGKDTLP